MLQSSTIHFLKALKKNNNKEWFDKNRKIYEQAKADYLNFVTILLNEIQGFDPSLMELLPKQCIFRLNRDVRFSKNKDPYKTNFGASFSKGAKKIQTAGYYFHLEPGENFVGGGLWMPMAPDLNKVRQEIDYCYKEFSSILKKPAFKSTYGDMDNSMKLVRPPKGFDVDNPALEYIKLKSFVVTRTINDTELSDKQLVKNVVKDFKTIAPLVYFLNRAIE
jgi:uncharacterized protein (TIGR02453 family)